MAMSARRNKHTDTDTDTDTDYGEGENERYAGRRVKCDICGNELSARSLRSHLATQHDVHTAPALSPNLRNKKRPPRTYKADYPFKDGFFWCPVTKCEGRSSTKFGIRRHFAYCDPQDYVNVPGEGRYAK